MHFYLSKYLYTLFAVLCIIMVLDILLRPKNLKGKIWELYLVGALYTFLAAFFGYLLFESYASIIMVTFTAIASVPFIHAAIKMDEQLERRKEKLSSLWGKHASIIKMFTVMFFGFVTAFTLLYIFLPSYLVESLFKIQIETILDTRMIVTGSFINYLEPFSQILMNNSKVLILCLIFSFFYGVGAIFVLSWNASVMGAAMGELIAESFHLHSIGSANFIAFIGITGYLVHGVPEIVAYFVAALAGGILSFAFMKEGFKSFKFKCIALESLQLFFFSFMLLFIAAMLEVFVSPKFF